MFSKKNKGQTSIEILMIIGVLVVGGIILGTFYLSNVNQKTRDVTSLSNTTDKIGSDLNSSTTSGATGPGGATEWCGDNICNNGETTITCVADCPLGGGGGGGPTQTCNNNLIEGTEQCDGTDLDSETCVTKGYASGTLACNSTCDAFNVSACVLPPTPPICGDGVLNGTDECEGLDFGGKTCLDYGFTSGKLDCKIGCTIDSSNCSTLVSGCYAGALTPCCGDDVCQPTIETCFNDRNDAAETALFQCENDCGTCPVVNSCGNNVCEPSLGECSYCKVDCLKVIGPPHPCKSSGGTCGDGYCNLGTECSPLCSRDCTSTQCNPAMNTAIVINATPDDGYAEDNTNFATIAVVSGPTTGKYNLTLKVEKYNSISNTYTNTSECKLTNSLQPQNGQYLSDFNLGAHNFPIPPYGCSNDSEYKFNCKTTGDYRFTYKAVQDVNVSNFSSNTASYTILDCVPASCACTPACSVNGGSMMICDVCSSYC